MGFFLDIPAPRLPVKLSVQLFENRKNTMSGNWPDSFFLFQCNSSASAGKPGNNHQEWEIFECTGSSACQQLPGAEACTDLPWNNTKLFQGVFVLCYRLWLLLNLVNVEVCAKTKGPWAAFPLDNSPSTLISCWQWGELGQGKALDEN